MVGITLFVLVMGHSRSGGFSTQLTLTVFYNIYMWHLGYLYLPVYSSLEEGAKEMDKEA